MPADPVVVRRNWLQAYDFTTTAGAAALNEYARADDPFAKLGKQQVAVDISSVIRASPSSFRVAWAERRYQDGALADTARWTAILTVVVQPPADADHLRKNPLGVYVTAINWSKELGHDPARPPSPSRRSELRRPYGRQRRTTALARASRRVRLVRSPSCSAAAPTVRRPSRTDYAHARRPSSKPIRRTGGEDRRRQHSAAPTVPRPADRGKAIHLKPPARRSRVKHANAAARVQPTGRASSTPSRSIRSPTARSIQVYTAPGEITDIALEPGEQLVGTGPVAAGDTVRWIIGDTESGSGPTRKVHILVKPTRSALTTNLIINTDRRTYLIELRSSERSYMASVSWRYPQDELIALRRQHDEAEAATPVAAGVDVGALDFHYSIEGDRPPWRPVRAFDDGQKVYIEFPSGIAQDDLPPLFVVGAHGSSELVNYRVRGDYYIVDRLFAAAELRLGDKASAQRVRIVRTDQGSR